MFTGIYLLAMQSFLPLTKSFPIFIWTCSDVSGQKGVPLLVACSFTVGHVISNNVSTNFFFYTHQKFMILPLERAPDFEQSQI